MTGDKVWFLLTLIMAVVTSHQSPATSHRSRSQGEKIKRAALDK